MLHRRSINALKRRFELRKPQRKDEKMKIIYGINCFKVHAGIDGNGNYVEREDEVEDYSPTFNTPEEACEWARERAEEDIRRKEYKFYSSPVFYRYIADKMFFDDDADTYDIEHRQYEDHEVVDVFNGVSNRLLWALKHEDPREGYSLATINNLKAAEDAKEMFYIVDAYEYKRREESLYIPRLNCTVPMTDDDIKRAAEALNDDLGYGERIEDVNDIDCYYDERKDEIHGQIFFEHKDDIIRAAELKNLLEKTQAAKDQKDAKELYDLIGTLTPQNRQTCEVEGSDGRLYIPYLEDCWVPFEDEDIREYLEALNLAPELPEILQDEDGDYIDREQLVQKCRRAAWEHDFEAVDEAEEELDAVDEAAYEYADACGEAYQQNFDEVEARALLVHKDKIFDAIKEKIGDLEWDIERAIPQIGRSTDKKTTEVVQSCRFLADELAAAKAAANKQEPLNPQGTLKYAQKH